MMRISAYHGIATNWEFARRAGGQVVHFICVIVNSLTRSVSFHWPYAGQSEQPAAFSTTCHCEPVRFPGVAISRIGEQFLVDEFRETLQREQTA